MFETDCGELWRVDHEGDVVFESTPPWYLTHKDLEAMIQAVNEWTADDTLDHMYQ